MTGETYETKPAAQLVDQAPNGPITDPCGCNQPHAVHQSGDAAFCRATLTALGGTSHA